MSGWLPGVAFFLSVWGGIAMMVGLSLGVCYMRAMNPHRSPETLVMLAEDGDWFERRGVARNSGAPVEALARLAKDADGGVRMVVAKNPSTPVEILFDLALEDEDWKVREAASLHPSLPEEMRAIVALSGC